jgi:hypothetical protein
MASQAQERACQDSDPYEAQSTSKIEGSNGQDEGVSDYVAL